MLIRVYLWDTLVIGSGGIILALMWPFVGLLAIPFRYDDTDSYLNDGGKIKYEGWKYIRLPKWARMWEGQTGCMGDGTQEYIRLKEPDFAERANSFFEIYKWFFRNSGGGWDRLIGFHMDPNTKVTYWGSDAVGDDSAEAGANIVYASNGTKTTVSLYLVIYLGVWNGEPKCFRHRTGYKVKPAYYGAVDRMIDSTFLSTSIKYFGRR